MNYLEDVELYRDDAAQDIKDIANATSKAARDELIERAQGNISEAERYLRIIESEPRAGDAQERRKLQQQVRTLKSQIDKLKSSLDRAKLVGDSQQRRQERPENLSAKDAMIRTQQQIDRNDDLLYDAQVVVEETTDIATNITNNLSDQRTHLVNARRNVDTTREDANEAGDHLQSLKRKHSIQIGLLYFIIFGLVVGIIGNLIKRLTS